jgi:chorismate synthase
MSGNTFGRLFKLTTFGESHGPAIGCIVDGCPPGLELSDSDIQIELDKRKPGTGIAGTKRSESDTARILSGVFEGKTTGAPIAIIAYNENQNPSHYDNLKEVFRPGHADYTYFMKYNGIRDHRGGGRSSARETLARVAAGAIAKKILAKKGISVNAFVKSIGGIECKDYTEKDIEKVYSNQLRVPDKKAGAKMEEEIKKALIKKDSLGGVVEVIAKGVPVGLGEPVYDKLSADIAKALMSINAAKGVEIGDGFAATRVHGSENNDLMRAKNKKASFLSNHAGGIIGGISNGEDIIARVAFKPVSSIAQKQKTITKDFKDTEIEVIGRHDVCICPRAVPVVEAMIAIVLVNALFEQQRNKI